VETWDEVREWCRDHLSESPLFEAVSELIPLTAMQRLNWANSGQRPKQRSQTWIDVTFATDEDMVLYELKWHTNG
jgi:hypothetical protein